jgi:hypothetical protein
LAAAQVVAAEAAVATEVPPGKSKSIRMRSLPAGAMVAVRIVTSGRLLVALVAMKQLRQPGPGSKPVFRGFVQEKLSFRVTIPEADDYVLVLSNRAGKETLKVEAEIRAVRRRPKPPPREYSPRPEKAGIPSYFVATSARSWFNAPGSTGLTRW